jgi:hypothetical protein
MPKLLLRLAALAILISLTGCSWGRKKKPTSSAHIYEGDSAPSIRYSDKPEAAGGPLTPY